ncbi:hypothetical protein D3C71_1872220 [compost metagenome]
MFSADRNIPVEQPAKQLFVSPTLQSNAYTHCQNHRDCHVNHSDCFIETRGLHGLAQKLHGVGTAEYIAYKAGGNNSLVVGNGRLQNLADLF